MSFVCPACIEHRSLAEHIRANASATECSYCENEGGIGCVLFYAHEDIIDDGYGPRVQPPFELIADRTRTIAVGYSTAAGAVAVPLNRAYVTTDTATQRTRSDTVW